MENFWFAYYPYICLTVMLVGIAFRYRYVPGRWNSRSSILMEKHWLGVGAPLFHCGVLLALMGHLAGLLLPDGVWEFLLGSTDRHDAIALFVGKFVAVFMAVGLGILLLRKLVYPKVRAVSVPTDYLVVLLIFVNIATGIQQVFFLEAPMFMLYGPWLRGILTFTPDPSFATSGPLFMQVHVVSAFTIFALIPYTRLAHFLSAPFTYAVRRLIVFKARYAGLWAHGR